ncbi:ultraviolet-B receptor UVR8 isoform X3 [Andrographis paniculata]|uniref:ultraviolet-B receptor UVR8 isoform X3 n=1 Tax=Andrographis paniculata TaxID=175694 RepID=UPI0021E96A92|nr:ultraviolet-B receptor UVR8 isoform X3 [Andrographis paniculata]
MAAVSRAYARAKKLAPVLNLASKESPAFGSVPRRWVSVDNGGRAEELNKGKRFVGVWGNGDFGRLGLGSLDSQWRPKPIASSAFDDQSLIEVACGGAHTVFLTENGDVYATGLNDFGQLGISDFQNYAIKPLRISSIPKRIIKISAGYHHSAAITVDGELYVWGKNANGQLGLGKKAENIIPLPRKVECLDGVTIKSVSLGFEHSIAVTDKGEALSWGGGESGRLGHGHGSSIFGFQTSSSEYTPRLIKGLEGIKVKSVAAGMLHSTCICDGGEMYTWGSNENGCLGIGGTDISYTPERVQGPLLRQSVTKVSCGWKHTAAISGGFIYTWGWGGSNGTFKDDGHSPGGQLGQGDDVDYSEPMLLNLPENIKATQISCGFNHTAALFQCS